MDNQIMVVDDDSSLRWTLETILKDDGRDVIVAEDGYQAIEFAYESRIALIFMDIQMPGINGVDAFIEIKKILPECTVVIMTGHALGPLIEKAMAEGAKAVLQTPLSIERLLNIVEEVVPV